LKKYKEAIESYDKVLEIDPENVNALSYKGISLLYLHNYDESELCYDKLLEIRKNEGNAWYNKACIESLRGNKKEAVRFLKNAIWFSDNYREIARTDEDFKNIRDSQEFKDLIE